MEVASFLLGAILFGVIPTAVLITNVVDKKIEIADLKLKISASIEESREVLKEYNLLVREYNKLLNKRNNQQQNQNIAFSDDDIRKLLSLCHPDKHGGKNIATEMTSKLLDLRIK